MSARPHRGTCQALAGRSLLCQSTTVCSPKRWTCSGGSSPRTPGGAVGSIRPRGRRAPLPNSALVSACVESSATTASAHGPERARIGRTKHSSRCGRSIVHPTRPPRISPRLSAHRLFARFVPASCPGLADPGRRPAFAVPACSWRAECPDLDGQCRNGHRADARADRFLFVRGVKSFGGRWRCCASGLRAAACGRPLTPGPRRPPGAGRAGRPGPAPRRRVRRFAGGARGAGLVGCARGHRSPGRAGAAGMGGPGAAGPRS